MIAALAVLLVVGVAAFLLNRPGDDGQDDTAGSTPSVQPRPKASTGTQDDTASGRSTDSSTGSDTDAEAREQFVRDYYRVAPGGSDEAWAMLGPGEKQQGRAAYDGFWSTIESVEVKEADASADDDVVEVTLVYRTTKGTGSTERKRETLTPTDDGFLLESDEPAS